MCWPDCAQKERGDLGIIISDKQHCEVKRFLGEGGKKRVCLARDTQLDREVALALIKTEGLDEVSRTRIAREAQAMGRLGSYPHIVTVFELGEHDGQPYMVTELRAASVRYDDTPDWLESTTCGGENGFRRTMGSCHT